MNQGYLPIRRSNLNFMEIRGLGRGVDEDNDIVYINRNGEMVGLGTMTEMRNHSRVGSREIHDRNGNFVGMAGELQLYVRKLKPTEEQLITNAKTPPSLKDLAFRQLPTSEIEAAVSLNKPFSDPESKTLTSLNNSDSSGGRSRKSRKSRRSRKSRKVRKSKRSRK